MTEEAIREQISQNLVSGGLDMEALGDIIVDKTRSLAKTGIELDADAVCHAFRMSDKVIVFVVVGRSVLAGPDAYQWLLEYQGFNSAAAMQSVAEIAEYTGGQVYSSGEGTMPIRNPKKNTWRAFKVQIDGRLKSVDEIRKKAVMLKS
jgi:hypothetical protein